MAFEGPAGLGNPFWMRVVGAEEHALGPDQVDQTANVVVVEGCDRDVPFEQLARTIRDGTAEPVAEAPQPLPFVHHPEQVAHPGGAIFDAHGLQGRKPAEQVVHHQGGEGVHDRPLPEHRPLEPGLLMGHRTALLAELGRKQIAVPGLGAMKGDGHAGLGQPGPEGIEVGMGDGSAVHGSEEEVHDPGAVGQHVVKLADGGVEVDQRQGGNGKDPSLVVEAPGLVEPAVERTEVGDAGLGIVAHLPLDGEPEARPH